jgi:hypothetical protein
MNPKFRPLAAFALLALAGCVTAPTGPSQMALPGTGKNFDQFRADDADCRQYAGTSSGGQTAEQAQTDSAIKSGIIGTGIGAAAGAAMGGHEGAGVGAGVGLLGGSMAGAGAASQSAYTVQQRYDIAYTQCMYAKGNKVPVSGQFISNTVSPANHNPPPPPSSGNYPPPPPSSGNYPPPPPGNFPPPPGH